MNGSQFEELVRLLKFLRSDKGCPWDKEQTSTSMKPYLIEEAYEVLDAIDRQEPVDIKEELGDLLLQIVFQAQIWEEKGSFSIDDVIEHVCEKLVQRHPHVFGDKVVRDSNDVLRHWEKLKLKERASTHSSLLAGVPRNLPALLMAQRVQEKVSRVGFDWEKWGDVWEKIHEELGELHEVLLRKENSRIYDEFGDFLFTCVNLARVMNISAEDAMRAAVDKFIHRFQHMESLINSQEGDISTLSLHEMDALWDMVKQREREE